MDYEKKNKKNNDNLNNFTLSWWLSLSTISIINILFFSYYICSLKNIPTIHIYLILLAFTYTIVCAIRSVWLRKDVAQTCFFDSKISTPLVGRTLATIAEICYVLLILIVLTNITKDISKITNKKYYHTLLTLKIILPIIIIAEIFSWLGCITKYYLWNAAEESLWMISGIILITISATLYLSLKTISPNNKTKSLSLFLTVFLFFTIIFVLFMITIDIPMYYNRWKKTDGNNDGIVSWKEFINDFKNKNNKLSLQSLLNLNSCKKISKDFTVWKEEIPWFTGYFTLGVWSSIAIVIWYKNYTEI